MTSLKNRRAVGGLISLIGLIVVFGITSVAYLELSSSQTNLFNSSFLTNQKISDRNSEHLNFTSIVNGGSQYDVTVENMGAETTIIHSYIVENNKSVEAKGEINQSVFAGKETTFGVLVNTDPTNDVIIFVTSIGKKCVIPADVSFRIC